MIEKDEFRERGRDDENGFRRFFCLLVFDCMKESDRSRRVGGGF